MPSPAVEHVAKALCEWERSQRLVVVGWDGLSEGTRQEFRDEATAAITTVLALLLEPSEEMIAAGIAAECLCEADGKPGSRIEFYRAMLLQWAAEQGLKVPESCAQSFHPMRND